MGGAAEVFAETGLAEATVQQVLERAGVSRRTFYQYFTGKEDVMAAVYDQHMDAMLVHLAGGLQQQTDDPAQKVIAALDRWLSFQVDAGALLPVLQAEAARPGSQLHARREGVIDAVVRTIDAAVQQVLGVRVDPLVFRGLVLGVEGILLHLTEHSSLAEERKRVRRVVAAMFLNVLAQASALPDPPRPR